MITNGHVLQALFIMNVFAFLYLSYNVHEFSYWNKLQTLVLEKLGIFE